MITNKHVHVNKAWKTPQFWLIWGVLCLNTTASIGIIGMASPLLQEVFGGRLINLELGFNDLNLDQKEQIAILGAGFTGLLSLFNIGGRFAWASLSDYIGRKATYVIFFTLGALLYALMPTLGSAGYLAFFVGSFCVIVSMYGGCFATIPAYLADMFGTQMVGVITGRLLTAWSTAGVIGQVLVNYIREYQIAQGVEKAHAYDTTMYIISGLLVLGLVLNLLVKPVASKYFMTDEELAEERKLAKELPASDTTISQEFDSKKPSVGQNALVVLAWLVVCIPLAYGFWNSIQQAILLFG